MNALIKVWSGIKSVYKWTKRNIVWVAGGTIAVLSFIFYALLKREKLESNVARKEAKVAKIEKEIVGLEEKKKFIRSQDREVDEEITKVEIKIRNLDEKAKSLRADTNRMSAKEKLDEFKKLGY